MWGRKNRTLHGSKSVNYDLICHVPMTMVMVSQLSAILVSDKSGPYFNNSISFTYVTLCSLDWNM